MRVPFDQLAATTGADAKLRKLVKNMVYVGVAAKLLSIDMESVGEDGPQAVCEEGEGGGAEPERGAGRLRLCGEHADQAGSVRGGTDACHRREDHHRRQCGRGDGSDVRRA